MEARAEAGLPERRPWVLWLVWGSLMLVACAVVVVECQLGHYSPPHFSLSVTGVSGLDVRSSDATAATSSAPPPTFCIVLRVENQDFGEHCYTEGSAAVDVNGVSFARADRLDGFCVPGRGAVEVPFLATSGGGLGIPDGLYGGVGEAVAVWVRLDGDVHPVESESALIGTYPVLLRCTVTLVGRPSEPCARFLMLKRGFSTSK